MDCMTVHDKHSWKVYQEVLDTLAREMTIFHSNCIISSMVFYENNEFGWIRGAWPTFHRPRGNLHHPDHKQVRHCLIIRKLANYQNQQLIFRAKASRLGSPFSLAGSSFVPKYPPAVCPLNNASSVLFSPRLADHHHKAKTNAKAPKDYFIGNFEEPSHRPVSTIN